MAVVVYDRHGEGWDYPEADSVGLNADLALGLTDASGKIVGGFNPASWSHYAVKPNTSAGSQ